MAIQGGVKKFSKFIVMREHGTFKQCKVDMARPQVYRVETVLKIN